MIVGEKHDVIHKTGST